MYAGSVEIGKQKRDGTVDRLFLKDEQNDQGTMIFFLYVLPFPDAD